METRVNSENKLSLKIDKVVFSESSKKIELYSFDPAKDMQELCNFINATKIEALVFPWRCLTIQDLENFIANIKEGESLLSLTLNTNDIKDKGIKKICKKFPNLKELDIGECNITDHGCIYLKRLTHLTSLNISFNPITEKGLISLSKNKGATKHEFTMKALIYLNITGCSFNDPKSAIDWMASRLKTLTSLEIGLNRITDSLLKTLLVNLPVLTNLGISHNEITNEGAALLSDYENLQTVNISNNKITQTSVLQGIACLNFLDYSENPIAEDQQELINYPSPLYKVQKGAHRKIPKLFELALHAYARYTFWSQGREKFLKFLHEEDEVKREGEVEKKTPKNDF